MRMNKMPHLEELKCDFIGELCMVCRRVMALVDTPQYVSSKY